MEREGLVKGRPEEVVDRVGLGRGDQERSWKGGDSVDKREGAMDGERLFQNGGQL